MFNLALVNCVQLSWVGLPGQVYGVMPAEVRPDWAVLPGSG